MSGRVRWRPFTGEPDRARMLVVGRMRVGDVVPVGDGWDATVYGTDERETFTRRRAATRWLLARAAGLAEVPRGPKFAQTAHGRKHGLYCENHRVAALPRGWRRAGAEVVHQRPYWIYERNRRRR